MLKIGDLVVHPLHGAGVIDNIVQERVAGTIQEYYEFRMCMGGLLLKIPVGKQSGDRRAEHHLTGRGGNVASSIPFGVDRGGQQATGTRLSGKLAAD